MIKINLIKQRSTKYKKAEFIRRLNLSIVFGSVGLFIAVSLYMSSVFLYMTFAANALKKDLKGLETAYLGRATEVVSYLRTKQIITNVNEIQIKRFHYKDFLLAIYKLFPEKARLASVDFSQQGVISFSARVDSISDYEVVLSKIDSESKKDDFKFKEIALKSLVRDKTGSLLANLEAIIK